MSLGTGYEYLLRSVVRGDVEAAASTPLTRYYAESGTPPGRFLGAGLVGLGDGAGVAAGAVVSERDLFRLLAMMQDPVTGNQLGATPMAWRTGAVAQPVAGFDLTFSVPKSVSAVWALADPRTQAEIYRTHLDAVGEALSWAEKRVLSSRSGHGGNMREEIRGVVATAFDHWDSRAGDPHLHTHVVVANRAQSVSDGKWRSLDSRTLFRYVVALSELHEGVLHDLLSDRLGYGWDERIRQHSIAPRHDITGVPDALIGEFSRRSAHIGEAMPGLVSAFAGRRGRQPSRVEMLHLRQQATLATRPDKQRHSLLEQTEQWRARARIHLDSDTGVDTVVWVENLRDRNDLAAVHAATIDNAMLQEMAGLALRSVSSRRATFSHANVLAEVHRQLHGARFATPADRLAVADYTTAAALDQGLRLTPPGRHQVALIYTTREILAAETRLLDAAHDTTGPGLPPAVVDRVLATGPRTDAHRLTGEQTAVVHAISGSGRDVDLLVGPAGTGKTTTLSALREVWEQAHGPHSVIGLAPSAAAAQVLGDELGIAADNTAKWLAEQPRNADRHARITELKAQIRGSSSSGTVRAQRLSRELGAVEAEHDRWAIQPGQLVIIDEASLAGTIALDAIVTQARRTGGKVLLVGDWAQLGAMEAGGAFAMLANDRSDVPELNQVHRFTHTWERDASTRLRTGDPSVIDTYTAHNRIRSGDRDSMLDELYEAWRDDTKQGAVSLMIAADRESVTALNERARTDRITAGEVSELDVQIATGTAGVGDQVVTRHNDRTLRVPGGWVKNGDTWTVLAAGLDGSLRVQRDDAVEVVLPTDYVREHVELGYATTAQRVQGRTVDTAHALISATNTREVLYVAATRGRSTNTLYVDTATGADDDTNHTPITATPTAHVLQRVLGKTGADTSAHSARQREFVQVPEAGRKDARSRHALFAPEPWTPFPDSTSMRHESGP